MTRWMNENVRFVVIAIFFIHLVTKQIEALAGVLVAGMYTLATLGAVILLLQCLDAFRSAFTGSNPTLSAPSDNPGSIADRLGSVIWGLIAGLMGTALLTWVILGHEEAMRLAKSVAPRF